MDDGAAKIARGWEGNPSNADHLAKDIRAYATRLAAEAAADMRQRAIDAAEWSGAPIDTSATIRALPLRDPDFDEIDEALPLPAASEPRPPTAARCICAKQLGDCLGAVGCPIWDDEFASIGGAPNLAIGESEPRPAALAGPVGVPEGWRAVPSKPTDGMVLAGRDSHATTKQVYVADMIADVYAAMLSAAPSPPAASAWRAIATAPKDGSRVLGCIVGFQPLCAYFTAGRWQDDHGADYPITHWMPLPSPPPAEGGE